MPEDKGRLLSRLGKQMRLEEAPSVERKLRRALRRDRFDELVRLRFAFDITSHYGLTRGGGPFDLESLACCGLARSHDTFAIEFYMRVANA